MVLVLSNLLAQLLLLVTYAVAIAILSAVGYQIVIKVWRKNDYGKY